MGQLRQLRREIASCLTRGEAAYVERKLEAYCLWQNCAISFPSEREAPRNIWSSSMSRPLLLLFIE